MEETNYFATGRRKEACARVKLFAGKGEIKVNDKLIDDYFSRISHRVIIRQPFQITNSLNKFDVIARVNGGGTSGQAGAICHGIARALIKTDESLRPILRKAGLISRDPRMKERKKYGQKGARKRFQWTKR